MGIQRQARFNRSPLTLALAAALFAQGGMAHAQDANAGGDQEKPKDEISELDTVKVTGSASSAQVSTPWNPQPSSARNTCRNAASPTSPMRSMKSRASARA